MQNLKLLDKTSLIIAIATLIVAFAILYGDSTEFISSLFAAILTALLVWMSYVIVRMIVFAIRKP